MKITKVDARPKLPEFIPRPYQIDGIKLVVEQNCGLLWFPGAGKTATVLSAFIELRAAGVVDKMIVLSPQKVAKLVWPLEPGKFAQHRDLKVVVCHGTKKVKQLASKADIYSCTIDSVEFLLDNIDLIGDRALLIVDESTAFKTTSTKRFKLIRQLLPHFVRRVILTGSFTTNGIMDLFGQVQIIDEGATLGKYVTYFRNAYFNSTGFGGHTYELQHGAKDKILDAIKPFCSHVGSEGVKGLPPLIKKVIEIEMNPKAARMYRQMKADMITSVNAGGGGMLAAGGAAVALSKCRQIANGGVYLDKRTVLENGEEIVKRVTVHLHDEKTKACVDLVSELSGENALIVYDTKHDFERLSKAFGGPPHIGAGVSDKELYKTQDDWNAGIIQVLLVHAASCSHGLNLQNGGSAIIWHSMTYNLEHHQQLNARLHRHGQKNTVFIYYICARDTIDQAILNVLDEKEVDQMSILNHLIHEVVGDGNTE